MFDYNKLTDLAMVLCSRKYTNNFICYQFFVDNIVNQI